MVCGVFTDDKRVLEYIPPEPMRFLGPKDQNGRSPGPRPPVPAKWIALRAPRRDPDTPSISWDAARTTDRGRTSAVGRLRGQLSERRVAVAEALLSLSVAARALHPCR